MKRYSLWAALILLLVASAMGYTLPERDAVTFDYSGSYSPDERFEVTFSFSPGNVSNSAPTFNETAPTFTISNTIGTLNVTRNFSDPDGDEVSVSLNDSRLDAVIDNSSNTFNISWNPGISDYGVSSVVVTLTDTSSNTTTQTWTLNVTNTAPTFNGTINDTNISSGETYNETYIWHDNETNNVTASVNCTFISVTVNNATKEFELYYVWDSADAGENLCQVTIDDSADTSVSNQFLFNVTLDVFNITNGTNYSAIVPDVNLSKATFNFSTFTDFHYTLYNITMENMTQGNPLYNVSYSSGPGANVSAKLNESIAEEVVGCACIYDYRNRTNLTTAYQALCEIRGGEYKHVWCWADHVNYNFTIARNESVILNVTVI